MKSKKSSKNPKKKVDESNLNKISKASPNINPFSLLDSSIQDILKQLGYESLTEIQQTMLSEILTKNIKNIVCKSPKNSGKMLSFLLPLVQKIISDEKNNTIKRYIIVTGIKERAHEIYAMSKELLKDINGKKVCVCVGGVSRKKENLKLMEDDIKLIISTPQRIVEYVKNDKGKKLVLNQDIESIIFDDVDSMEKNGYIRELKDIINIYGFNKVKFSGKQQKNIINENINFIIYCHNDEEDNNKSNKSYINELINLSEREYKTIIIKDVQKISENKSQISKGLITKRGYIILDPSQKFLFLLTFLRKNLQKKILIFFATSKEVLFYNSLLNLYHFPSLMIYSSSSKSIKEHNETLSSFTKADKSILLCTDLSKMRLNVPLCDWIIFYDCPIDIESFESNLEIKNSENNNDINNIKAFMILMENELDILKQKKEININEFNVAVGNIDKDQEKVEKMVNTKEQNVLVLAYDAYKDFLFNYASRSNKNVFNVDDIDVTKLCKSFGFKYPPYVNFSSLLSYDNYNEKKSKKKSYLFPDEIQKIYGNND